MATNIEKLPTEMMVKISEYLTGPELASLNWASQGFNTFCNEIKFYNKFNKIDVLDIPEHFQKNGCHDLNMIIVTPPKCCVSDESCSGAIYQYVGENYCDYCMTEYYGEVWKTWEDLPPEANRVNNYLTVKGVIVNQSRDEYGPTHYDEDDISSSDSDEDEPVGCSDYWLKDQHKQQKLEGERDVSYDIVFQGPSTPWLDEFIHTEHAYIDTYSLEEEKEKKYKEECVLSGKRVGRLHIPVMSPETSLYYSDTIPESEIRAIALYGSWRENSILTNEGRIEGETPERTRWRFKKVVKLFLANHEFDGNDLEVLI